MVSEVKTLDDLKSLLPMAYEYHSLGVLPYGFNEDFWLITWSNLIKNKVGLVWVSKNHLGCPVNALGGVLGHDLSQGDLTFTETFFYASKASNGSGFKVLKRAQKDLAEMGVKRMYLNSRLNYKSERTSKFYSYMGFVPNEVQWVKEL